MATRQGDFIWYELMSRDADAAQQFYSGLLGWQFVDSGMPGFDYLIGSEADTPVVGLMSLTEEMMESGVHPMWTGYIAVDDVDESLLRIGKAGGHTLMQAQDIESVGRIAMVCDPQQVPFYIMRSVGEDSQSFARYEPAEGHCAWNELVTSDPTAAKAFYGEMFGWQKADEMDMGKMGLYEMMRQHDYLIGAIMKKPDDVPVPMWVYYFRVADIEQAAGYISENQGRVLNGPMQIPGGEYILHGLDPQGAMFALIGKR